MPNRKLLIVSYLFPPAGGIAVQRAISLAKYLPQCGFDVHVLRAGNASAPVRDPALLRQIPPSVAVHSAFAPEIPFQLRHAAWKWLSGRKGSTDPKPAAAAPKAGGWKAFLARRIKQALCPEPEVLWVPFAVRKARQIIKKHGIEAILITAPPFSAFLAGNQLKKEFPGLKVICDFRDEWLSFYLKDFEFQSSDSTRRRAEEIERETVEKADLVVAVTQSSLQEIRQRYPEQPDEKFFLLFNGYDPEMFTTFRPRTRSDRRMVVTHVGTAYKTASPRFYLDALDELPEELRARVETRFIGRISEAEEAILKGRKSPVKTLGFMPQSVALQQMEDTDYLLLTMTNDISLPGKLFEYLATGKPILALSPKGGEVDRILRETGAGWCVDPGDRAGIQAMIRMALEGSARFTRNEALIRSFERPALASAYGQAIHRLIGPGATAGDRRLTSVG